MTGWQWIQLDNMQVTCISLQTDNHASTSKLTFYMPDALPAAQPTVSKHCRQCKLTINQGKKHNVLGVDVTCQVNPFAASVNHSRSRGRPKRTWLEVVQRACQVCGLSRDDAMVRGRWRKLIRMVDEQDGWHGVWMDKCFFWYQLTRTKGHKMVVCVWLCLASRQSWMQVHNKNPLPTQRSQNHFWVSKNWESCIHKLYWSKVWWIQIYFWPPGGM